MGKGGMYSPPGQPAHTPTPKKMGRPTLYTPELASKICQEIGKGKSLTSVLKDDDMPGMTAVFDWLIKYEDFAKNYARATNERVEVRIEKAFDIADDAINDYMEDNYEKGKTPGYQLNGENIQRSKLRVDLIKWYASRMLPKKYGDKLDVTSDGEKLEGLVIIKDMPEVKAKQIIEGEVVEDDDST